MSGGVSCPGWRDLVCEQLISHSVVLLSGSPVKSLNAEAQLASLGGRTPDTLPHIDSGSMIFPDIKGKGSQEICIICVWCFVGNLSWVLYSLADCPLYAFTDHGHISFQ